ncbi:TLC domain-containing protein 3A-like [Strongylocentrotus purpuratus]|uniref:TLC domain-containing protein n=1 Tax=Strongylocentrotus purpuratus TaxID=7668 RepID=A0A7M7T1M2_STRPU|nr:TLC domain-containing protein 3A-like [Strongylocentrotus purpuratus]
MSRTYTDIFYKECKLLDQSFAFATSYWFYDVVAMYMVYCREKQLMETTWSTSLRRFLREHPLVCVHHVLVAAGGYPLVLHYRFGKAAFMIACVQVTELSTPFINIRKILIKHCSMDSMMFKVNTVVALATFFLTRIVLFPNLYVIYAYSYHLTLWEVATSMYFGCHLVMFCVTLMQVTWFVGLLLQFQKITNRRQSRTDTKMRTVNRMARCRMGTKTVVKTGIRRNRNRCLHSR